MRRGRPPAPFCVGIYTEPEGSFGYYISALAELKATGTPYPERTAAIRAQIAEGIEEALNLQRRWINISATIKPFDPSDPGTLDQ